MYLIKEVAKLSSVSVRTLHYYDQIGLLTPQKRENGYRYYTEKEIDVLQQILFFKRSGLSLKRIQAILTDKNTSKLLLMEKQLAEFKNQEQNLKKVIATLEKTIKTIKGESIMTTSEKFEGLHYEMNEKYQQEAMEKYGKETVENSLEKQQGNEQEVTNQLNVIFFGLAECVKKAIPVSDEAAQSYAKDLYEHIRKYSFDCSLAVFESIGNGYVEDERFKNNLDKFGTGVAEYARETIQFFVKEQRG